MSLTRHCDICDCIKSTLDTAIAADTSGLIVMPNTTTPFSSFETRIEDFQDTYAPDHGISVSPERDGEKPGLNSTDDIVYSTLITRTVHALENEDKGRRLAFRTLVRVNFHNKKILCTTGCLVVSTVDFGPVAVPKAWDLKNKSVSIMRVNMLVRESRTL